MVPPSAVAPAAPPAAPAPRARVAAEPGGDGVAAPASAPAPVPRLELRSAVLERFGAGGAGAGNGRAAPAPGGAAASPGDLCDPGGGGGGGGGGGASVQALGERGRSQTLPAAAAVGAGLAEGLEDVGRSLTLPGAGRGREAAPAAVTVTAQRTKTWPLNLGRGARLPFAPRPQAASSTRVPGQGGAAALTRSATRAQTPKRRAGRRC